LRAVLSISHISIFFNEMMRPFLFDYLKAACESGDTQHSAQFTNEIVLSNELAVTVPEHANRALPVWKSDEALGLVHVWSTALGQS
jgi:hypothetical protein